MIKEIELLNFQSHANTKLVLDKGINTIIGSSDSGKSAILRAFYWVKDDRPLGTGVIRHGTDGASVTVVLDNDVKIARIRNKNFNGYVINDTNKLEANRSDVPQEVCDAIGMTDVNVSKQMDSPFLISESAGEVARFFNKSIKLDIIDKILSLVESNKRVIRQEIESLRIEKTTLENKIDSLGWVVKAKSLLDSADAIIKSKNIYEEERKSLLLTIQRFSENKSIIDNISPFIHMKRLIYNELCDLLSKLTISKNNVKDISALNKSYLDNKQIIESALRFDGAEIKISNVEKRINVVRTLKEEIKVIKEAIDKYNDTCVFIDTCSGKISDLKRELPDLCPICGSKIDKEKFYV